jgi:F-type H+-transporting ATPase subunit epsilon
MAFEFEILTPQQSFYKGSLVSLVAPGMNGSFGVLSHHAPLVARSAGGKVKVSEVSSKTRFFEVGPGVVEVLKNRVVILTREAKELS